MQVMKNTTAKACSHNPIATAPIGQNFVSCLYNYFWGSVLQVAKMNSLKLMFAIYFILSRPLHHKVVFFSESLQPRTFPFIPIAARYPHK